MAPSWRHFTCCTRGQRSRCPAGPQNAELAGTAPHRTHVPPAQAPGAAPGQADEDATSPRRWQVGEHVTAGSTGISASVPRWAPERGVCGHSALPPVPHVVAQLPRAPSLPRGAGDGVTVPPIAACPALTHKPARQAVHPIPCGAVGERRASVGFTRCSCTAVETTERGASVQHRCLGVCMVCACVVCVCDWG